MAILDNNMLLTLYESMSEDELAARLSNASTLDVPELKALMSASGIHGVIYSRWQKYADEQNLRAPDFRDTEETVRAYRERMRTFLHDIFGITEDILAADAEVGELLFYLLKRLEDNVRGMGVLEPYYQDNEIEEIVYRNGRIWIEKHGRLREVDPPRSQAEARRRNEQLLVYARNLGSAMNVELTAAKPYGVYEVPPKNDRFAVVISPLNYQPPHEPVPSIAINLRKYHTLDVYDLQRFGTFWDYNTLLKNRGMKAAEPGKPDYYFRGFMRYLMANDIFGPWLNGDVNIQEGHADTFFNRASDLAAKLLSQMVFQMPGYPLSPDTFKTAYSVGGMEDFLISALPEGNDKEMFLDLIQHNGWGVALGLGYFVYLNLGSFIVSGEFSSGKTTLLNAFTPFIRADISPIIIEEYHELQMQHPGALRLVTKNKFDAAEVLNQVMTRFRPDLIIVSEIVSGAQVREFLTAANLGKKVAGTTHSNSAKVAPLRLETLGQSVGLSVEDVRIRFATGITMIVHQGRDPATGARFVSEIIGIGDELVNGQYDYIPIYSSGRSYAASEVAPPLLRHIIGMERLLTKYGEHIAMGNDISPDAVPPETLVEHFAQLDALARQANMPPFEYAKHMMADIRETLIVDDGME